MSFANNLQNYKCETLLGFFGSLGSFLQYLSRCLRFIGSQILVELWTFLHRRPQAFNRLQSVGLLFWSVFWTTFFLIDHRENQPTKPTKISLYFWEFMMPLIFRRVPIVMNSKVPTEHSYYIYCYIGLLYTIIFSSCGHLHSVWQEGLALVLSCLSHDEFF